MANLMKLCSQCVKWTSEDVTKCPVCGKRMLMVKGKNSEMLICQDRACAHREVVSRTSNARCPVCHKKLELRGKEENQIFVCSCGYKEKLQAFKERRKKERRKKEKLRKEERKKEQVSLKKIYKII